MECGSLGGVCSLVIGVRIGIIALLRLSVYSVSGADSLGVVRGLDGSGLVNQLFRHCGFDRFRLGHLTGRLDLQAFRSVVGVMFPTQSEGDEILRGGHIEDVQCSGRAYADQFRRGSGSGSGIVALIALVTHRKRWFNSRGDGLVRPNRLVCANGGIRCGGRFAGFGSGLTVGGFIDHSRRLGSRLIGGGLCSIRLLRLFGVLRRGLICGGGLA